MACWGGTAVFDPTYFGFAYFPILTRCNRMGLTHSGGGFFYTTTINSCISVQIDGIPFSALLRSFMLLRWLKMSQKGHLSFGHTQRKTDPILILGIRFTKPLYWWEKGGRDCGRLRRFGDSDTKDQLRISNRLCVAEAQIPTKKLKKFYIFSKTKFPPYFWKTLVKFSSPKCSVC